MSASARDLRPKRHGAAVSGALLAALVLTAVFGLAVYLTPPHLPSMGPDEVQFWVATRVAWVVVAVTVVTLTVLRFVRRGR